MCGIIGVVGCDDAYSVVIEGLKRLEYRGYDSAGIAVCGEDKAICCVKAEGKIAELERKLGSLDGRDADIISDSTTAIGHTRWATHGAPNEVNAHPHCTDKVAVVHNGIIENYSQIKSSLVSEGVEFVSDTDTEVVTHLIAKYLSKGYYPQQAVERAVERLEGAYALAIIFASAPDMMIAVRKKSPLAIGYGTKEGELFIGSDAFALSPFCKRLNYLEDGDMAILSSSSGGGDVQIFNSQGQIVKRPDTRIDSEEQSSDGKGDYAHYMLKEIYEQPTVVARTLQHLTGDGDGGVGDDNDGGSIFNLGKLPFSLTDIERLTIVACGTSYYAAQVASYWFEQIALVPTSIDVASEFRYRKPILAEKGGLALFISQSGETADTLAALRYCKAAGQHTLALVNVSQSSMAMEADSFIQTKAGVEIGVASTKAFTTQLVSLAAMAIQLAVERGAISVYEGKKYRNELGRLPEVLENVLTLSDRIKSIAKTIFEAQDMLYIGRGTSYAIACEGALKMKETPYIHAEGYAAGELKHGPIALIDSKVPVIVVAPKDELFDKTASNLQETAARGGRIVLLSSKDGIRELGEHVAEYIEVAECGSLLSPIVYSVPLQLLAYYTATLRGTDVDQPRNLAKSVTVE